MRIGTALQFKDATLAIQAGLSDLTTPLIVWHGSEDVVTSPAVSRRVWDAAASADKTLVIYEGGWHVSAPRRRRVGTGCYSSSSTYRC